MMIDFYSRTRTCLLVEERLSRIEGILRSLADCLLGNELFITSDEDIPIADRERVDVRERGWLSPILHAEIARSEAYRRDFIAPYLGKFLPAPAPPGRLGSLHFVTRDESAEVFLEVSERPLLGPTDNVLPANELAIGWLKARERGQDLAVRCAQVMHALLDNDLFEHGYCCSDDEYYSKNIDRTGGGIRAVGVNYAKYLPGFYWANYFGAFLRSIIGDEVLLNVPGCISERVGDGILVCNVPAPDEWSTSEYAATVRGAIDHISRQLFFEKDRESGTTLFVE
jgi:hypothetical protein